MGRLVGYLIIWISTGGLTLYLRPTGSAWEFLAPVVYAKLSRVSINYRVGSNFQVGYLAGRLSPR
jgi:hypothetical protein